MNNKWVSEVAQSCPTLCDLVDQASPSMGFSRQELEWVTISFSNEQQFTNKLDNLG